MSAGACARASYRMVDGKPVQQSLCDAPAAGFTVSMTPQDIERALDGAEVAPILVGYCAEHLRSPAGPTEPGRNGYYAHGVIWFPLVGPEVQL